MSPHEKQKRSFDKGNRVNTKKWNLAFWTLIRVSTSLAQPLPIFISMIKHFYVYKCRLYKFSLRTTLKNVFLGYFTYSGHAQNS